MHNLYVKTCQPCVFCDRVNIKENVSNKIPVVVVIPYSILVYIKAPNINTRKYNMCVLYILVLLIWYVSNNFIGR
jgi:hypothetical protein